MSQSKYNLNESDFMLIGELQKEAFYYRNTKRNYSEAFQRWVSISLMIDCRFESDERDELNTIQSKFTQVPKIDVPQNLNPFASFGSMSPRKKYLLKQLSKHKIEVLDEYIQKLRTLMRTYKIALTDLERKAKLD